MQIVRLDEKTVALLDLDAFFCELLQQITACADPTDSSEAEERLYSSPTHGREPGFDQEWKEFVEPDLRSLFGSTLDTVRRDLKALRAGSPKGGAEVQIPVEHLDDWVHALNQARLAMAARYAITEKDMSGLPTSGDGRALAIFQIHFYGYLQECFLRELGSN